MAAPHSRPGPGGARRPAAWPLRFVTLLALACGPAGTTATSPPAAPGHRPILLIGIDAGDWAAIDPLVAAGKLPAFARLKAHGRTGLLLSTPPLLSPILWTTIATGRSPEDHGVLDFMVDLPGGGQAPVSAASRRVPALWNLFSEAGRRVAVVGWWATWPAEDVRGTIVSDRVAPQLSRTTALAEGSISPRVQSDRLTPAIVRASTLRLEDLRSYGPISESEYRAALSASATAGPERYADRNAHLATVVAATRTYGQIAAALLAQGQPDLLAVYLEGVDTVSHLFVRDTRRGPPAVEAAYRDADALMTRLAAASDPETWVVVCSDHGFYPADAGVTEDPGDLAGPASAWHRPYGIVGAIAAKDLAPQAAPSSKPTAVGTVTPLDIAPTLLHATGLPVGERMPGHVVTALLPPDAAARPVARAAFPDVGPSAPSHAPSDADPDAIARLQALGYVGSTPTSLARRNLGEVLYRRGNLPAAERELRAVVDAQPRNVTALLWLGKTLRDEGRPRESLRAYERAAMLPDGRDEALVAAAEVAASAGMLDEGRRILDAATARASNTPATRVARGILAGAAGDAAGAERELRGALALAPLSVEALTRLLDLLVAAHRTREALPLFDRAAADAPSSPRHLALLGEALLASGDAAKAEVPLTRASSLAPDNGALRIDLARALVAQKKLEPAETVLADAPPSPERDLLLGAVASSRGRWAEAAVRYEAALKVTPPTPDLLNGLAWAKLQSGDGAEAARLLRQSLALDGRQPDIRRLLGEITAAPAGRPR